MIVLISPAKRLNLEDSIHIETNTKPVFIKEAEHLVKKLRKNTPQQLSKLMGISKNLAELNNKRFLDWSKDEITSRQAVFTFDGDVYSGLDAYSLTRRDIKYAQKYLRILSGLYGILRPLDGLHPYRLEMGTKFKIQQHADLYGFWWQEITRQINQEISETESQAVLNLASNEYSKVINRAELSEKFVDVTFKDKKNGEYKVISFNAKKARGMMARFIIKNKVKNIEDLKDFSGNGYVFSSKNSSSDALMFLKN